MIAPVKAMSSVIPLATQEKAIAATAKYAKRGVEAAKSLSKKGTKVAENIYKKGSSVAKTAEKKAEGFLGPLRVKLESVPLLGEVVKGSSSFDLIFWGISAISDPVGTFFSWIPTTLIVNRLNLPKDGAKGGLYNLGATIGVSMVINILLGIIKKILGFGDGTRQTGQAQMPVQARAQVPTNTTRQMMPAMPNLGNTGAGLTPAPAMGFASSRAASI